MNGYQRAWALVCVALAIGIVVACYTAERTTRPDWTTVLVTNDTGSPLRVFADGVRMGTVTPGVHCLPLRGIRPVGRITLTFKNIDGEINAPAEALGDYAGWKVSLGPSPSTWLYDVLAMVPAPRCT